MLDDVGPELSTEDGDRAAQRSEAMVPVGSRIAAAVQSSMMYCRAQTRMTDLEIDEVVLTGGGSRLPGLRQMISRRLGIPAVPADTLRGVDLAPLPRKQREELEAAPEGYATALGLALSQLKPEAVHLSVLPRKLKERRRFLEKTVYVWLAGAALLGAMGLVGYSSVHNVGVLESHTDRLESKLKTNQEAKARMLNLGLVNREYAGEVSFMHNYLLSPRQLLEAFAALRKHVPPEVELSRFAAVPPKKGPARAREVVVEGYVLRRVKERGGTERLLQESDALAIIGRLRDALIAAPVFDPPPKPGTVIHRVRTKDVAADKAGWFELHLRIRKQDG
jgi:cell division ATPase FtsA